MNIDSVFLHKIISNSAALLNRPLNCTDSSLEETKCVNKDGYLQIDLHHKKLTPKNKLIRIRQLFILPNSFALLFYKTTIYSVSE